jgi:hypothetical protein
VHSIPFYIHFPPLSIISQSTYDRKQGDALTPRLFKFALEYAIRKVQENQVGLKLNEAYQLLAYADYSNLLGGNLDIIERNTQTLTDTSKEDGLEVNSEKTKYMLLSHHYNAGQNHNVKISNRSFENAGMFQISGKDSNKSKLDLGDN